MTVRTGEVSFVSGGAEALFGPIVDALRHAGCATSRTGTVDEVTRECDALVVMGDLRVGSATFARLPRLRLLASPIIGVDGFDLGAATERGIAVVNAASTANAASIAEAAILMTLAALYRLPARLDECGRGARPREPSRMLGGRTIGLIGFGAIARQVAERLKDWNCPILVYARRPVENLPPQARQVELDVLIAESDVVMPLATLNDQSRHLLDGRRLRLLRPGAILVNLGRGALIDETALAAVLAERPDLGIALDTFEVEPLPADSPLRAFPDAILTGHCIGHSIEAGTAMQRATVDHVLAALAGRLPAELLNPAVADRWRARFGRDEGASA